MSALTKDQRSLSCRELMELRVQKEDVGQQNGENAMSGFDSCGDGLHDY